MFKKIREFFAQKGQGVVEYALLLGVVAIITLALFNEGGFVEALSKAFSNVTKQVTKFNAAFDD